MSSVPDGLGVRQEQADSWVARPLDNFFERMLGALGGGTSVSAVFGQPVEQSGVTVVPVARVRFLLGGGLGAGPVAGEQSGEGGGGGGAVSATPVGYLEVTGQGAQFRPIHRSPADLLRPAAVIAALGLARALSRAAKRRRG